MSISDSAATARESARVRNGRLNQAGAAGKRTVALYDELDTAETSTMKAAMRANGMNRWSFTNRALASMQLAEKFHKEGRPWPPKPNEVDVRDGDL